MHVIIDGYNLIRQSDSLRHFERISLENGRKELIRKVSLYKKSRGHKITIVFDGWASGSPIEERDREEGIDIIYSRKGEKADEVIKRMVKSSGEEIVVVTSDRGITDSISRNGGVAISSPEFEIKMDEMRHYDDTPPDDEDQYITVSRGTKKKGPSRKISRKKRGTLKRTGKL
ncbi:MAG: NYN domain-containing protein [Proteobacteria bacterium]|nr:NYN domain-containing protein [Pseudomonadota bacterium]